MNLPEQTTLPPVHANSSAVNIILPKVLFKRDDNAWIASPIKVTPR